LGGAVFWALSKFVIRKKKRVTSIFFIKTVSFVVIIIGRNFYKFNEYKTRSIIHLFRIIINKFKSLI